MFASEFNNSSKSLTYPFRLKLVLISGVETTEVEFFDVDDVQSNAEVESVIIVVVEDASVEVSIIIVGSVEPVFEPITEEYIVVEPLENAVDILSIDPDVEAKCVDPDDVAVSMDLDVALVSVNDDVFESVDPDVVIESIDPGVDKEIWIVVKSVMLEFAVDVEVPVVVDTMEIADVVNIIGVSVVAESVNTVLVN